MSGNGKHRCLFLTRRDNGEPTLPGFFVEKKLMEATVEKRKRAPQPNRAKYQRRGGGLLMNEAELATALGENVRTIRSLWHAKIIPAYVLGRRTIRYRLEDVLKALSKREVKSVADRNGK